MFNDKNFDEMTLTELEEYCASFPKEIRDKVDGIMRAIGIALGEARAAYFEKLMNEN